MNREKKITCKLPSLVTQFLSLKCDPERLISTSSNKQFVMINELVINSFVTTSKVVVCQTSQTPKAMQAQNRDRFDGNPERFLNINPLSESANVWPANTPNPNRINKLLCKFDQQMLLLMTRLRFWQRINKTRHIQYGQHVSQLNDQSTAISIAR